MQPGEDYHLHTTVSDGDITPENLVRRLVACGVRRLSITDHDTVGAYLSGRDGGWDIVAFGQRAGATILPGIEMDSIYQGIEIHVLGYEFNLDDRALNRHLDRVRRERDVRVREQIEAINRKLGDALLDPAEIFIAGRFTVMSPHVIRPLLARGHFSGHYGTAKRWMKENIKTVHEVAKPSAAEAVRLIREAGGRPVIAHPGFYIREEGLDLPAMLRELRPAGLWGVEVDYHYENSDGFDAAGARAMVEQIGRVCDDFGLPRTSGTDTHSEQDFARYYPPVAAGAGRR